MSIHVYLQILQFVYLQNCQSYSAKWNVFERKGERTDMIPDKHFLSLSINAITYIRSIREYVFEYILEYRIN